MSEIDDNIDALERAILEIDAMVSIFCHDFSESQEEQQFTVTAPEALERARTFIDDDSNDCHSGAFDIPRIDVEVVVRPASDNLKGGIRLRISLPPGYPSMCGAEVTVLSTPKSFSRSHRDELSNRLQRRAKELIGSEAMMEIINDCTDAIEIMNEEPLRLQVSEENACADQVNTTTFSRRWIWVHHITNVGRLKQIVSEAQNLHLGGFLKGGYPGVVVVEGNNNSCDEFISWIKGNKSRPGGFGRNWGHHVRGEATSVNRQLPESFKELEDNMGKLGGLCKEFGVEEEFREFILQHK